MILEAHKKYYIEHLKELGFNEKQSEGLIELHIESGEHLATKADITHLETTTKAEISRLESNITRIETKIDTNNKWIMGLLVAIFTVLLSEGIGIIIMLLSKNL